MKFITIQLFCVVLFVAILHPYVAESLQYETDQDTKIIGLKHFEEFLSDMEKKIAEWTKRIRNVIVDDQGQTVGNKQLRQRRQEEPPRKFTDWIVIQDVLEGVKYAQKQITDFVDRISRVITGEQMLIRDSSTDGSRGPYVPVVKELREFLVHLQRRLTAWSKELERVFGTRNPNNENNLLSNKADAAI